MSSLAKPLSASLRMTPRWTSRGIARKCQCNGEPTLAMPGGSCNVSIAPTSFCDWPPTYGYPQRAARLRTQAQGSGSGWGAAPRSALRVSEPSQPARSCSSGSDRDATRLRLRLLRDRYLDDAVAAAGLDLIAVDAVRQDELAVKPPGTALDSRPYLALFPAYRLFGRPFAGQRKHAVGQSDLDLVRIDTRQIHEQGKSIVVFMDIHSWDPIRGRAAGFRPFHGSEQPVDLIPELSK